MIEKLLVANRGEIASRVMRTAREMDIRCVAVFSDADVDAPFVADADEAVHLPGNSPSETYLRADLLVEAARRTGADAVHPGYGFLSENAAFARACAEADLVFVGPSPEVIEAMGSKITAKELMSAAGVPILQSITVNNEADFDAKELGVRTGTEIGYPVLVKAAYGGGGRGMRIVHRKADLADAVVGACREAAAAFGDGTVFLERYVDSPRHVEVQIFGDAHGNVVHLFERECSIQRRYQKIIEEAPSPAVDEALRTKLGEAAVAAGKAIGYVGAGTVEFVLGADGQFAFLEVNTRLQVEHPVTELVTKLDLVRLQLTVAEGLPLPDEALFATLNGHAVETRLYAEDVSAGFLPATGTVHAFLVPELDGIRVDAGVADGSVVSVHYDPMLAKVIAHGHTRDDACRRLARTLAETRLHGVVTNQTLLVNILREPEFRSGNIDTGYLTRHDPAELSANSSIRGTVRLHAVAAALAGQAERRAEASVLATLPTGWRNVPNGPQRTRFAVSGAEELEVGVAYRFVGDNVLSEVDGEELPELVLRSATRDHVDLDLAGVRRTVRIARVGDTSYVDSPLGSTVLHELPRFPDPGSRQAPGSLLAPMPGTVVRVEVDEDEHVAAGTIVVVLEAMKMEHSVTAPLDGVVREINVKIDQTVDTGAVLAVVEEPT
ncbi:biotin carboxylase N-terminal domain-containing protein [Sciscionella marina]|uniref:ATP-binding protein n=1 Tax=Sciscionella marina TaxID=508770 RepID=UPI0003A531F1|nr:biotin carboxylase N-terminal domain-containing protein [Sciscionella marina]